MDTQTQWEVLGVATIATRADPQHEYLHVLSHRFPGKEDAFDQRITEFNKKSMFLLKSCKDKSVSLYVFVYV